MDRNDAPEKSVLRNTDPFPDLRHEDVRRTAVPIRRVIVILVISIRSVISSCLFQPSFYASVSSTFRFAIWRGPMAVRISTAFGMAGSYQQ